MGSKWSLKEDPWWPANWHFLLSIADTGIEDNAFYKISENVYEKFKICIHHLPSSQSLNRVIHLPSALDFSFLYIKKVHLFEKQRDKESSHLLI